MPSTIRTLEEIGEDIKDIISFDIKGYVHDYHVAESLGMTPANYATHKKRKTIPYNRIILFCYKRHITTDWLLLRNGAKHNYQLPYKNTA